MEKLTTSCNLDTIEDVSMPARARYIQLVDTALLGCLMLLAGTLPYAGVTACRDIGLLTGAGFWILLMVLRKEIGWVRTSLDLPFLLLFITALLSLITAVDFRYSLSEIRGEMLKGMLLFYMAAMNVRDRKRACLIVGCLLAGALVMDVFTLTHFFLYGSMGAGESGLHSNAPELGTFLVQAAPFAFFAFLVFKDKPKRLGFGLLVLLHVGATYVTFSRMSMLAVIFEIALLVWLWSGSWKWAALGLLGCGIVFQLTAASPVLVLNPNKAEISSTQVGGVILSGEGKRLTLWKESIKYVAKHPFQGIGYGRHSFKKKFPEMKKWNSRFWHAHNVFINAALELGVQGFLALLFLLYRVFSFLWPGFRGRTPNSWKDLTDILIAGVFISTAGLFFRNLTDDIYNNDAALLVWLIVGLGFSLKLFQKKQA